MNCPDITTLEQAEAKLPSSVLPIDGLRRGQDGVLTSDAQAMIMDGLKSRGVDISDKVTKDKLIGELMTLLCSVNKQYQFLLRELYKRITARGDISEEFIAVIHRKNLFMTDILTISRLIETTKGYDGTIPFIEGWQNAPNAGTGTSTSTLSDSLARDRQMLQNKSYEDLRKHMVHVTGEKNKIVSNNLGMYGFLNLLAVGLIIYVAGLNK
jgi:hypothetical protein